ncbi:phosphotransferase [Mycobacterium pseudoshottsii JCM 15466]|nr:phosphotransferase [Mycobacterium pseudoshottsii JCM 15466]
MPENRVIALARLATHLGRGLGRVATGAVLRNARAFPRRIHDLDPPALSEIMGRRVSSVSVLDDSSGTTSRARLALSGNDVPESVFVKMAAATAATRFIGELGRLAETEVGFYRDLSPELAPDAPTAYGCAFDPLTGRFVLVLEDLAAPAEGTCDFSDTLHPFDNDQAALVVELLARLHATYWVRLNHGGVRPFGWLYAASRDPSVPLVPTMLRASWRRLGGHAAALLPGRDFVFEHYRAITGLIDAPPHTVLHGDAHPGNWYFRSSGGPLAAGLLDWQAVRLGHPARDLAYTLITGMTTTDRRVTERELLGVYRRALAAAGGPELDREELWLRYRQAAAYAYVATTIVAGLGGMQAADIALTGLDLTVATLHDLQTVAALRAADLGGTS